MSRSARETQLLSSSDSSVSVCLDVDDEYEDEDQWEEGAEDILEKGEEEERFTLLSAAVVT